MSDIVKRPDRDEFALALPAQVSDVERIVALIERIKSDDEDAHGREDDLHRAVMEAIANGTWRDSPAALCRAALKTREIEFARWCA